MELLHLGKPCLMAAVMTEDQLRVLKDDKERSRHFAGLGDPPQQ